MSFHKALTVTTIDNMTGKKLSDFISDEEYAIRTSANMIETTDPLLDCRMSFRGRIHKFEITADEMEEFAKLRKHQWPDVVDGREFRKGLENMAFTFSMLEGRTPNHEELKRYVSGCRWDLHVGHNTKEGNFDGDESVNCILMAGEGVQHFHMNIRLLQMFLEGEGYPEGVAVLDKTFSSTIPPS